jgi:hypothetical protein
MQRVLWLLTHLGFSFSLFTMALATVQLVRLLLRRKGWTRGTKSTSTASGE